MIFLKASLVVFGTICIFIFLFTLSLQNEWLHLFLTKKENETFFQALSGFSNLFMAIAAIFNLVAILYFFSSERQKRIFEERTSNRQYWFRTVLIQGNLQKIEDFFNICEGIIYECDSLVPVRRLHSQLPHDRVMELYGKYTDAKINISHQFIDVAAAMNEELGKHLNSLFEKYQDQFTEALDQYIQESPNMDKNKIIGILYVQKSELIKDLYYFSVNNCLISPKNISLYNKLIDVWIDHEYQKFCIRGVDIDCRSL